MQCGEIAPETPFEKREIRRVQQHGRRVLGVQPFDCAAESTCEEAPPVSDAPRWTSEILAASCDVPSAARCTLREISWVAAPCSSTAEAIVEEISEILVMVAPI